MAWMVALPYGARLIFTIEGESGVNLLSTLEARAADIRPVLGATASLLRQSLGSQFALGGTPPWQALANTTVTAKRLAKLPPRTPTGRIARRLTQRGEFGSAGILIATGALRDSYRQKGAKGHIEQIDASSGTVRVGSALKTPDGRVNLARLHQKGTGPYRIAARLTKALAFSGRNGESILRRSVRHPGLPARPVCLTATDRAQIAHLYRDHFAGVPRFNLAA